MSEKQHNVNPVEIAMNAKEILSKRNITADVSYPILKKNSVVGKDFNELKFECDLSMGAKIIFSLPLTSDNKERPLEEIYRDLDDKLNELIK